MLIVLFLFTFLAVCGPPGWHEWRLSVQEGIGASRSITRQQLSFGSSDCSTSRTAAQCQTHSDLAQSSLAGKVEFHLRCRSSLSISNWTRAACATKLMSRIGSPVRTLKHVRVPPRERIATALKKGSIVNEACGHGKESGNPFLIQIELFDPRYAVLDLSIPQIESNARWHDVLAVAAFGCRWVSFAYTCTFVASFCVLVRPDIKYRWVSLMQSRLHRFVLFSCRKSLMLIVDASASVCLIQILPT